MLPYFRFHHIGIAVKNIDNTARIYINAGYCKTETVYDPIQHVNICFLSKQGMPVIELLEPIDESSPVFKTIEKNGVTPYHHCYEVDDISIAIKDLRKLKFIQLGNPVEACAINNRKVAFFFNQDIGLIEIVEY